MKIFGFFLICFLTLQALPCRSQQNGDEVKTLAINICSVIATPDKYDGTEIVVKGLYRVVIHGAVLTGSACSETYASVREASNYKADVHASSIVKRLLKKDKSQPIAVVVRGTFRVAQKGQCFGGDLCARYQVEIADLISAEPAPPGSPTDSGLHTTNPSVQESDHGQGTSLP
jgi:hypothetical protein